MQWKPSTIVGARLRSGVSHPPAVVIVSYFATAAVDGVVGQTAAQLRTRPSVGRDPYRASWLGLFGLASRAASGPTRRAHGPRRQLEVLRAYIRAGSLAAAAHELGTGESTVRQHLSGLYRRTGCLNAAQAAYLLGSGGLAA